MVLSQVLGWAESMTSVYTTGEPGGRGFPGHEPLRAAGAEALVVLPLGQSGALRGSAAAHHSAPIAFATEDIELLELLALQATSALATAERSQSCVDRVLVETASALEWALRAEDRLYRIAGDEFAVLVRVADKAEAATGFAVH